MSKIVSLALCAVATVGVARADSDHWQRGFDRPAARELTWDSKDATLSATSSVVAPEIDPASAMAGLTMLAGGLAVLRGRRRMKSKE